MIFCTKQEFIKNELLLIVKSLLLFLLISSANGNDIDINKFIQVAKKQNKHIMFFHHIPGCPYCKAMLDENFKDANILKEIKNNFIYIDIYTANKNKIKYKNFEGSYKEFSKLVGAFVYPSTIFMDDNGKIVHKSIGYRNIDEYIVDIKYVSTKHYKKIDLETYIEKLELEDF